MYSLVGFIHTGSFWWLHTFQFFFLVVVTYGKSVLGARLQWPEISHFYFSKKKNKKKGGGGGGGKTILTRVNIYVVGSF